MISVLLPVRDGERYLASAIQSVLDQTFTDLELIIIDDGSTDASGEIADGAAARDARVRPVHLAAVGLPSALNVGIEHATHRWIARMDADDRSLPTRLERQITVATTRPEVLGWGTWAHGIDADGGVRSLIARGPTSIDEFRRQHARGSVEVNHATMLMDRDALIAAGGYDPTFDRAEDVELWDRLGEIGPLLTLPEPLYQIRIRGSSHHAEGIARGLEIGRFVAARRRARDRGRTLTPAEFAAREEADPAWRRVARRAYVLGRILHYRATVAYFDRRMSAAVLNYVGAALLAPQTAIPRAFRQLGMRRGVRAERRSR